MVRVLSTGCMVLGMLAMLFALTSSGAVSGSTTLNIGLLVDKIVMMLFGGFLWITGVIVALSSRGRA